MPPHGAAADGARLATVNRHVLHRSIVSEIARGIRVGIYAERLDGLSAHRDLQTVIMVNERGTRLDDLRSRLADTRRRAKCQQPLIEDAESDDERKLFQSRLRELVAHAANLQSEIDELENQRTGSELDDFDGEVEYLLAGLEGLCSADGTVDDAQHLAIQTVFHDFSLTVHEQSVDWSTRILIPAEGAVVSLGPFAGTVPITGRPVTAAHAQTMPVTPRTKAIRRDAITQLEDAGYETNVARVAVLAPGGYLSRALLGEVLTWPDCDPQFDHEEFNAYLRDTYQALTTWRLSTYNIVDSRRQDVVDLVAQAGGRIDRASIENMLPTVGSSPTHLHELLTDRRTSAGVVPAVLRRSDPWYRHRKHWSKAFVENYTCPVCREPVTGCVLLPEIRGGLICRTCLVEPANPSRRFPPLYAGLTLQTST